MFVLLAWATPAPPHPAPPRPERPSPGLKTRVRKKPQQLGREGRRPAVPSRDSHCGTC